MIDQPRAAECAEGGPCIRPFSAHARYRARRRRCHRARESPPDPVSIPTHSGAERFAYTCALLGIRNATLRGHVSWPKPLGWRTDIRDARRESDGKNEGLAGRHGGDGRTPTRRSTRIAQEGAVRADRGDIYLSIELSIYLSIYSLYLVQGCGSDGPRRYLARTADSNAPRPCAS
jgi:hypothetical protein